MHKNTLADIVIKAVRIANSVIDSSYEFPEMSIRTNNEILFRDNVIQYCNACHDQSLVEERAAYTKKILEYAASLQANEEYGNSLPMRLKTAKKDKILYCIAIGLSLPATAFISPFCVLGVVFGAKAAMFEGRLEKKIETEYYDYSLAEDTAKELREVPQKEFNEAMFGHWDELMVALDDISEQEKKRLLGKKR
ncbi:MAG: hypothetical protein KJ955_08850 [Nanoarchaeota archaeon]|nr:hypothetical protein [Nanoarchaeota archaeon]